MHIVQSKSKVKNKMIQLLKDCIYLTREKIFSPIGYETQESVDEANVLINQKIKDNEPFLLSRFGNVELDVLLNYKAIKEGKPLSLFRKHFLGDKHKYWEKGVIYRFGLNAGFFPLEDKLIENYCELILSQVHLIDILGCWIRRETIFDDYLLGATKIKLENIEPFFAKNKWTDSLEGKNVLVIHPQNKLIEMQYNKRELIWPGLLPEFNLITLQATQSAAGAINSHRTWFEAIDEMKKKIDQINYDIAIIGAGAYGMPLGFHIKNSKKQAIHLGGVTQVLFGIKGRRWVEDKKYSKYMNEHWSYPSAESIPPQAHKVENGCYW